MTQPHYIDREAVATTCHKLLCDELGMHPDDAADSAGVFADALLALIAAPMEAVAWREKVARLIEDNVEAEKRGPGEGWLEVVGIYDAADAILQALAVIPTPDDGRTG